MCRRRSPISWWARLALLPLIAVPGCGYTLNHRLTAAFEKAKGGIFVPVFSNVTDELGAEKVFTDALIRELQSRGQVTLTDREDASAILEGTVTAISYPQTAYTDAGVRGLQPFRRLPSEYGVTVEMTLRLVEVKGKNVLWASGFRSFQRVAAPVSRTYNYEGASSVGLLTQSIIDGTYENMARNIMRDVYDEMVEIF